jgi:hypothetical protein
MSDLLEVGIGKLLKNNGELVGSPETIDSSPQNLRRSVIRSEISSGKSSVK